MITYVALLRGINVGGRTVKMAELKLCFQQAGFSDVATVLQSGNVVFASSSANSETIRGVLEAAVHAQFGFTVRIIIVRQDALMPIVQTYPFDSTDEYFQHYILFLRPGLSVELATLGQQLNSGVETIAPGPQDGVLYWRVEKGKTLDTPFAKLLTKTPFKDAHTARNIKTIRKLLPK